MTCRDASDKQGGNKPETVNQGSRSGFVKGAKKTLVVDVR